MFLVIQFDDASNDRFEDIQIRSSETRTQLKAPKRRFNEHAINQDIMTRLKLIHDEFTNLHFAADRSRKSPESQFNDTQHPIEAQPDSLRASLRDKPRRRFVRTEARRATRQDAERAWRICGTTERSRRKQAALRFFRAERRENAGNGKSRTPIIPWVARFCLILFFFAARGWVTRRNRSE